MRISHLALACISTVILSACGGGDTTSEPAQSSAPAATPAPTQQAELTLEQRGRIVFKKCQACHTLAEGDANRVGPNLWNVIGSPAAAKGGFAYSEAMKSSGLVWDEASLDAYLEKPSAVVPKGSMVFIGLKKPEDREAVIAFLRQETTPKAE